MLDITPQAGPSSGAALRPAMKRERHTWHGDITSRSHFEDFMLEIGVDAREHHLCCLPRQVTIQARRRAKSDSFVRGTDSDSGGKSKLSDRRKSFHTETRSDRRFATSRPASARTSCSLTESFCKVAAPAASKLKTQAVTAVHTQSYSASSLYPSVPAERGLRLLMGDGMVARSSQAGSTQLAPDDQEQWTPLPRAPALTPIRLPSILSTHSSLSRERSFSRAPSFASLETISSSEGPETPLGHSPFPSPAREMSPTLLYLEQVSKMRVPALCVTCQKAGQNFPSCPTCGDTWCSRECRVGSQGKRHTCQKVGEAPMILQMSSAAT